MKHTLAKLIRVVAFSSCVIGSTSWAANNPFVGDWKLNPARSKLTDVMKVERLGANKYSFNFGGGSETIVVDGTDQPGGFGTTLSIAPEGTAWKVIRKKDGRMLISAVWTLSADGSKLTDHYTSFDASGSPHPVNYVYTRKAAGSGFAGEWVSISETVDSIVTLQVKPNGDDGLSFIEPSISLTRNLKFDGQDYPNLGPNVPAGSTASIRRVNDHRLEMASKLNGELLATQDIELSADLKTLTFTRHIVGETEPYIRVFERL